MSDSTCSDGERERLTAPRSPISFKGPYMATKSLKISPEHHRRLKIASLQRNMKLQYYIDLLLDWALSEHPVTKHLREEYFDKNMPTSTLE